LTLEQVAELVELESINRASERPEDEYPLPFR